MKALSIAARAAGGTRRSWWAWVALPFFWTAAAAQPLGSGVPGSWMSTGSDGPPTSGLQPSAWWDQGGFGWSLGGSLALDLGGAHVIAPMSERAPRAVVLELGAWRARMSVQTTRARSSALSARVHLVRPTHGVWLASSGFEVDRTRGMLPWLGVGTWWERGRFTFTTRVVHLVTPLRASEPEPENPLYADSSVAGVGPSPAGEDIRLLTGAETSVTWALERFLLQSRVGIAVGVHDTPTRWGELRAAYWARPGVGLFARVRGTTEAPAAIEAVRETHAALGVQLTVGGVSATRRTPRAEPKPGFRMVPLGDSRYRVTLSVPGHSVELCGDATEWQPLAARRVAPDRWEAVLVLTPGVHRLALRVDGGPWQAPPGVPTAPDGFGGEIGLIVVD